jgi:hypothetical protein
MYQSFTMSGFFEKSINFDLSFMYVGVIIHRQGVKLNSSDNFQYSLIRSVVSDR